MVHGEFRDSAALSIRRRKRPYALARNLPLNVQECDFAMIR